jgi:hypothetical protein
MNTKAVSVSFNERGYFSKGYTYLSNIPVKKGDIVVVPTNDFWSIGKVTNVIEAELANLKSDINYKHISLNITLDLGIGNP